MMQSSDGAAIDWPDASWSAAVRERARDGYAASVRLAMSGPKPAGVFRSQHVGESDPTSTHRRDPAAERRRILQETLNAEARNRAALQLGLQWVSRLSEGAASCVAGPDGLCGLSPLAPTF